MNSLDSPPTATAAQHTCTPHQGRCPTHHLTAFQRTSGKWRGTMTHYTVDGQLQSSLKVETENRLDCDSYYALLITTDAQGNQQRLESTVPYSRKLDGFLLETPTIKGTAREVGESIVFMFDEQLPTGTKSTFEVLTVRGKDRFQTLQYSLKDGTTGYTIIHQTRVDEA